MKFRNFIYRDELMKSRNFIYSSRPLGRLPNLLLLPDGANDQGQTGAGIDTLGC